MEKIDAKLQDLKDTFKLIDRATTHVQRRLLARGATTAQIEQAKRQFAWPRSR